MQNRQQAATVLGWAGVAPFLVLLGMAWLGGPQWLVDLMLGYALVIFAFMCGSLWAGAMSRPADSPAPLVASNVLVLAALIAVVIPFEWAMAWLALLFAAHALAEWKWVHRGQPGWYRRLRLLLSTTVIALLALAAAVGLTGG
ncbi:MAG: DUF3429 domain-containing protein [Wenzhouxiangellaceae bacterium]|nr:DUF3429 domain-containing protein [Wenzhouxiangellaceae bacterium]